MQLLSNGDAKRRPADAAKQWGEAVGVGREVKEAGGEVRAEEDERPTSR